MTTTTTPAPTPAPPTFAAAGQFGARVGTLTPEQGRQVDTVVRGLLGYQPFQQMIADAQFNPSNITQIHVVVTQQPPQLGFNVFINGSPEYFGLEDDSDQKILEAAGFMINPQGTPPDFTTAATPATANQPPQPQPNPQSPQPLPNASPLQGRTQTDAPQNQDQLLRTIQAIFEQQTRIQEQHTLQIQALMAALGHPVPQGPGLPAPRLGALPLGPQPLPLGPQPLPLGQQPLPLPLGQQPLPLPLGQQPLPLPLGQQPLPLPLGQQPLPLPLGQQPLVPPPLPLPLPQEDQELVRLNTQQENHTETLEARLQTYRQNLNVLAAAQNTAQDTIAHPHRAVIQADKQLLQSQREAVSGLQNLQERQLVELSQSHLARRNELNITHIEEQKQLRQQILILPETDPQILIQRQDGELRQLQQEQLADYRALFTQQQNIMGAAFHEQTLQRITQNLPLGLRNLIVQHEGLIQQRTLRYNNFVLNLFGIQRQERIAIQTEQHQALQAASLAAITPKIQAAIDAITTYRDAAATAIQDATVLRDQLVAAGATAPGASPADVIAHAKAVAALNAATAANVVYMAQLAIATAAQTAANANPTVALAQLVIVNQAKALADAQKAQAEAAITAVNDIQIAIDEITTYRDAAATAIQDATLARNALVAAAGGIIPLVPPAAVRAHAKAVAALTGATAANVVYMAQLGIATTARTTAIANPAIAPAQLVIVNEAKATADIGNAVELINKYAARAQKALDKGNDAIAEATAAGAGAPGLDPAIDAALVSATTAQQAVIAAQVIITAQLATANAALAAVGAPGTAAAQLVIANGAKTTADAQTAAVTQAQTQAETAITAVNDAIATNRVAALAIATRARNRKWKIGLAGAATLAVIGGAYAWMLMNRLSPPVNSFNQDVCNAGSFFNFRLPF